MRGPWRWDKDLREWWGRLPSWWKFPMKGSCGGEGGEFLLLRGVKRRSLMRKRKMKRRGRKSKVVMGGSCSNNGNENIFC